MPEQEKILSFSDLLNRAQRKSIALPDEQRKDLSYNANTQYLHGNGGLLAIPGVEPDIFSTIYRPRGLSSYIPMVRTVDETPLFGTLTNVGAESGSEPADVCSAPPVGGSKYAATLTAPFGKIMRGTPVIDTTALGKRINRSDPMDLNLVNQARAMSRFIPNMPPSNTISASLQSDISSHLWNMGLAVEKKLEDMMFTGDATTSGTGFAEFNGLETLVNTGKVDALTGLAVAALDPQVVTWGSNLISADVAIEGKTVNFVQLVANMIKRLEYKGEDTGLVPQLALVMARDLFWELTEMWACAYYTTGCTAATSTGGERFLVTTGAEQTRLRDDMRSRSYLMINGRGYPVITTDSITSTADSSGVKSEIYILPMTANGRMTLYLEYFDMGNSVPEINNAVGYQRYAALNDGFFQMTSELNGFCLDFRVIAKPRLILRTPWLAGRITNVVYKSILHTYGANDDLYTPPTGGFTASSWALNNTKVYPTSV